MRVAQSHVRLTTVVGLSVLTLCGCATEVPALVDQARVPGHVVVGRILTVITGERARRYGPEVRFFEVEERRTQERFRVEIESSDRQFVIELPPGEYLLHRVQISEGPFMSMADLAVTFSVGTGPVTYVGTWRFGVDSPRYGRMVVVSVVLDQEEKTHTLEFLHEEYPALAGQPVEEMHPQPPQVAARLFEVMPYPRIYRYFRRHWW